MGVWVERSFTPRFERNLRSAIAELERTDAVEAEIPETGGMKVRRLRDKLDKPAFSAHELEGQGYLIYTA